MKHEPWLPYLATEYLEGILTSDSIVFEWGSGGSTLFFAERCKKVICIEHDPNWFNLTQRILPNMDIILIPPEFTEIGQDASNPSHYKSFSITGSFYDYVNKISAYDNFDIIFVDGRARASCIKKALDKIVTGGWIVIDNTERDFYLKNIDISEDKFETVKFFGHGPKNDWPWETTFLRKVQND